ncbi:MAG: InlB B-repeat-containing protein [Clostridia bacterium]|nr:InlB B-repeat-containing protein [Clostridia bacterium]
MRKKYFLLTISLLIILSAGFAFAKYVLFSEQEVTVTLKDATINETQITVSPSSWTNDKVAVTIESEKGGQIYYKVGETGTWNEYSNPFDVFENDTVYSKLVFKDADGPEALKDVDNIDKIPPTKTAPTATATTNTIVVTSKQEDYESGIVYEEFAIKKDGVWYTQQLNNFEGLTPGTMYVVKTISTDLAGNVQESDELEVTTADMTAGSLTFKKDNANGEVLSLPETPEQEKTYINSNVYFELIQGTNGETTYEVKDESGNTVDVTDNTLQTSTGTYEVILKTTDGSNTIEKTYYIYVDKTPPTEDAPVVEATTGKITITNNQTDLESGIAKIEYGIFDEEQNEWVWQETDTFAKLTPNKEYKVKTKATDKAGNVSESAEVTIKTKELTPSEIIVKENDESQTEINPSETEDDTNKDWANEDIIIETTPEEGTTVTVTVKDENGNVVEENEGGEYPTTDGKYEITVTTKDEDDNTIEEKYYVFVDKTNPTLTVNPNGNSYTITPGNTQTQISVDIEAIDNESGISKITYGWSSSNTEEPTQWIDSANGATIENTVSGGTYYLWTQVIDNAGNIADQKVSEAYTVNYQVVYNANGGENAPESTIKVHETDLILSSETPTRTGYTFKGWATTKTATTPDYTVKGTYNTDAAVTLYAVWEVNTYNITYNTNGGTFETEPDSTYTYGNTQTLPTPTKEGYTFEGWYEDETLTNKITQINADKYGDLNLYANYTANKYTVQYDGNGETSGEVASQDATYDQNITIANNGFTKTGYTFVSWNTKSDATGTTYNPGDSVNNLVATNKGTITLYAIWEDKTAPTTTAPSATSNVSSITVTFKQTDDGEGIDESTIEYGIFDKEKNEWVWQKDPTFTGLNSDTEYEVKTRASDKNGNGPVESQVTKIKTTTLEMGDLTFKKNDANGEVLTPATDKESQKSYINTNVYIEVNPSSNGTTTYTVKYEENLEEEYSESQTITTSTGTYEITVTTKTESESYSTTYYIYIDKTEPSGDLPTAVSTTGKITVTNNQTDNESGIAKVEYGILKDGVWTWQESNEFAGLADGIEYEVRTRTTDNAGNVKETESLSISTKELTPSTVKVTETTSGDEITPSTSENDANKDWTNENIKIETTAPNGATVETKVYKEDGTEVTKNDDGTYSVEDGTYKVVVTTKDEDGNTKEETYYIFVDKTNPEVTVVPDGGDYTIPVGQTTIDLSATINVTETGSGTNALEYAWSTSQTIIPTTWNTFTSGTPITYPVEGGNYYLWLNVTDNAGNKATKKITNVYKVVYVVEFDANGGQNAPATQEKEKDVTLTLSSVSPTKAGYTFKGWAESENTTTAKYQPAGDYIANASVKLYAVWEANTYNIEYNLNGGTFNNEQDTTYTYDQEKTLPTADEISKPGYDFDGWYNEAGEKVTTLPAGTIDDITLEAHWTARTDIEYTVNYYLENANTADYTLNHTETRTGETDKIIVLADVQNPTTTIENATYSSNSLTANTKIDAVNKTVVNVYYTRNKFELNLIAGDNITQVTGTGSYKWGQSVTINATIEDLAGYTYKWNNWTSSDTGVLANQANQAATIAMPASNISLTATATRTIIEYTILKQVTQDGDLNSNKTEEIKYNVETESFELPIEQIEGYTFKGWTINDETQLYDTITITKGTTGNNTYTAVYADETGPSTNAPTGSSTTSEITLTFNQTDSGSGIDTSTIEYGIYKDGKWTWQSTPTFEGLDANTDYKVKTRVTDNQGNGPVESAETTIRTKSVDEATLTFRKNDSTGEIVNFPNADDSSVWVNTDIHVTANSTPTAGVTTTYKIVDENGVEQTINSNGILETETGKYTATITTTDGVNEKTVTYYIYVDKTEPSATVEPNGGEHTIAVGSSTTTVNPTLSATDNGGSELKDLQYAWSSSNIEVPETWENAANDGKITKALSGGTSYLWTKVTDNAGNTVIKASSGFKVGYAIEYDSNGGDVSVESQRKEHDVNITLSDEITKTGYNFAEWNTDINGNGTSYAKTAVYTQNASIKLYAIWTAKTYDITYDLNGGTIVDNDSFKKYENYTYNTEKVLPTKTDVTKPGYELDYWVDQDGNQYTTLPVGTIENITLTAHWKPTNTTYTVYHYVENINDENYTLDSTDENVSGVTESVLTLEDLKKTITGATYKQGSETENGTAVITVTINGDGSTKIYLYYSRNTYTLTINKNSDIGTVTGAGTYKYGKTVNISAEFANLPGYNYSWEGWTSSDITVPTTQSATITMPNKNVTITASASKTIITYNIEYDLAGGTLAEGQENPTTYTVESQDFTLSNPTKTGYTFAGWDDGEGNISKDVTISIGSIGDKTYTAVWTINEYTVTYDYSTNGGTNASKTTDSKAYKEEIDLTTTAEKDGYTFIGWNTNKDATEAISSLTMETSDITLYAIFSKEITVEYKANGGLEDITQNYTVYNNQTELSIKVPSTPTTYSEWEFLCYGDSETATSGYGLNETITITVPVEQSTVTYYSNWKKDISVKFMDYVGVTEQEFVLYNSETITVTAPAQNAYEGWTALGWTPLTTTTAVGTNVNGGTFAGISTSTVYYGLYEQTITLSYNLNGGTSSAIASQTGIRKVNSSNFNKATNPVLQITDTIPTRDGYTFVNWKDSFDKTYETASSYTFEANTEIRAVWETITYNITYELTGGSLAEGQTNPSTYTVETNTITLYEPTKEGYEFRGWQLAGETAVNRPCNIEKGSIGDRTYVAVWTTRDDIEYKVEFYYQENGVYPDTATFTNINLGTTESIAEVSDEEKTPTKEGYTLDEAANNVLSGTVAPDGGLVLKVYFKQQFTVTYKAGTNVSFETETYSGLDYGVTTPSFAGAIVVDEGYEDGTWTPTIADTVTSNMEYVYNSNGPKTDTKYKVEYYYQVDGSYPDTATQSETRTGTTDTAVTLSSGDKTPAQAEYAYDENAENITTGKIAGDGSLVLKVYFKQQFTVTFKAGNHVTFTDNVHENLDYGAPTPGCTANYVYDAGYSGGTWTPELAETVTSNATYTLNATPNENTRYQIEYYYQENGQYSNVATDSETREGTTDTTVDISNEINNNIPEGYALDTSKENVLSGNINGNGNLVLKVYYKQQFTVKYLPGEKGTFKEQTYESLDYGAQTPEFTGEKTGLAGYTFSSWSPEISETVTKNTTYTALWTANTNTSYTIQYYKQSAENGQYPETPTEIDTTKTGKTDTTVDITNDVNANIPEGYALDTSKENILSGNIDGDGSLVLKVYYKLQFTVTYTAGNNVTFGSEVYENLDYGVQTPEFKGTLSYNSGYGNGVWTPIIAETVTANTTYTLNAVANTNTKYKVEYYYQVDGKYSDTPTSADETRTGITDANASVTDSDKTPTMAGYVFDEKASNVLSGNIAGDGSLVLKVYFKQQFTVTYKAGSNVSFETETYSGLDYGTTTPSFAGTIVVDAGYQNGTWTPSVSSVVTSNIEYVYNSNGPKTDTPYTVHIYGENAEDTGYTLIKDVTKTGTTNSSINIDDIKDSLEGYGKDSIIAKDGLDGNTITTVTVNGDGSSEVYLYYSRNTYTLNLEKGTNIKSVTGAGTYKWGSSVQISAETNSDSGITYNWLSWTSSNPDILADQANQNTTIIMPIVPENEILTLTANASANANEYSITYVNIEGVDNSQNPSTYTYGESITFENPGSKTGYTFDGWYLDTEFTTEITGISATQKGNITVYAKFDINKYTVTYNALGGTCDTGIIEDVAYGTEIDVKNIVASKAGSIFKGWTLDPDSTTPLESLTMGTSNVILYAIYVDAVAQIDEAYYESLQDAIDAAGLSTQEVTITMLKDVNQTGIIGTVSEGQNIKLNLNGKTIQSSDNSTILNNGTLTISGTSGTITGSAGDTIINTGTLIKNTDTTISNTATESYVVINNTGTVTMSAGTLNAGYRGIVNNGTGTVTISGGTLTSETNQVIRNLGSANTEKSPAVKITGNPTITATSVNAIVNDAEATGLIHIDGGIINSSKEGISTPTVYNPGYGKILITGGTIKSSGTNAVVFNGSSDGTSVGTIEIRGGTIESDTCKAVKNNAQGTVIISGGNIVTNATGESAVYNHRASATTSVTGGTITSTNGEGILIQEGTLTVAGSSTKITGKTTGIRANVGNATITGGTIEATEGVGVWIRGSTATVTIGTNESGTTSVNTTTPTIIGTTSGVETYYDSGIFNFYDGQIIGPEGASINSTVGDIPVGYAVKKTIADGIETATLASANYVNITDNKYYLTLSDAVSNATSESTIKVLNGVTETITATVESGKKLTIDMNGQTTTLDGVSLVNNGTLTISGTSGTLTGSGAHTIENTGTLTKDTNTTLANTATADYLVINNSGTFTMSAGTLNAGYRGIVNNSTGTVTISGGILSSGTSQVIRNYGSANTEESPAVKITGNPTITATSINAIVNDATAIGLIHIDGGIINSSKEGISTPTVLNSGDGKILITGGTIKSSGTNATVYNGYNNGNSSGTLEIRGGTIENSIDAAVKNHEHGRVIISGGTISGSAYGVVASSTDGIETTGQVQITGGTINAQNGNGVLIEAGTLTVDGSNTKITGTTTGIRVRVGTATITGGTIEATAGVGVFINGATVTVGTNESGTPSVSTTTPSIIGTKSGVETYYETGIFNFYDGQIKGAEGMSINSIVGDIPVGYVVKKTIADGIETATLAVANYQNTTDNKYFYTLAEAVTDASNGSTIKVLNGVTESEDVTVDSEKTLTIDMNGQTTTLNGVSLVNNGILTISGTSGTLIGSGANTIENTGKLVKDTNTTISSTATADYYVINNSGTFTMSEGTLNSEYRGIMNEGTGTVMISGGTLTTVGAVIRNDGSANTETLPAVKITGNPTITSTSVNCIVNSAVATGLIHIDGGSINSSKEGISTPTVLNSGNGKVLITGGKITSSGTNAVVYNGSNSGNSSGTIEIRGGVIQSDTTMAIKNHELGTVIVSGGTITSAKHGIMGELSGTIKVTGGTITAGYRGIYDIASGTIEVSGGTITSTYSGTDLDYCGAIQVQSGGTVKISGENTKIVGTDYAVILQNGEGYIAGGTIEATGGAKNDGTGIYNTATLTIGTNESTPSVSTSIPTIIGNSCGVMNTGTNGTFNFYDGQIKGAEGYSISGTVSATPTGYVVVKNTEDSIETATLGASAPVITSKLVNSSGDAYKSGTWSNKNVYVSVASAKVGAGIKQYEWKEGDSGTWKTTSLTTSNNVGTITFTGNRNSTIYFRAVDNNGAKSATSSIIIRKETTKPTVTLGTNGGTATISVGYTTAKISSKLTAADTGGSELKTLQYAWSQSNTTEPTSWTTFTSGSTVTKDATGGNWYLWTNVVDNAGNRATSVKTSNAFVVKYQVAYDANGGTDAPSAQAKTKGTAITLTTNVPTKAGYTFLGWGTSSTATKVSYKSGGTYSTDAPIKLYAIWQGTATFYKNYLDSDLWGDTYLTSKYNYYNTKPSSITTVEDNTAKYGQYLQFTMNEGTTGGVYYINNTTLTVGTKYTWSMFVKTSSNKTLNIGCEQGEKKDVNTTTSWQKVTYTFTATSNTYDNFVIYNNSGWSEGDILYIHSLEIMEGTPTVYDTKLVTVNGTLGTLPTTPTRTGYTFQGWYTAPVGGTKITTSTEFTANTTYYAHWTTNNYTITYDYNSNRNYINPTNSSITFDAFTGTTNYTKSVGTVYMDDLKVGDKITVTFDITYSDVTTVADQTAFVLFQGQGDVTSWSQPLQNTGSKLTLTGTGTTTYTANITITETLAKNSYFKAVIRSDYYSAGTMTMSNFKVLRTTKTTVSKPYGVQLGTLPTISDSIDTLNGWYTAKTGGTKISSTTLVTGNGTYYAQWTRAIASTTIDSTTTKYSTVQAAIDAAGTNSGAIVTLLEPKRSESVTIASGQNIIYNSNGKTLTHTGTVISCAGTLTINGGGTISATSSGTTIKNTSSGTIDISDVTINSTNYGAIRNESTGRVNISSGTIKTTATGSSTIANVSTGTTIITGGTITNTGYQAIEITGGNLVIGDSANASTTSPSITGSTNAISSSEGYITIYGGAIRGARAINKTGSGSVSISGGAITSTGNATIYFGNGSTATLKVTGGSVKTVATASDAIISASTGRIDIGSSSSVSKTSPSITGRINAVYKDDDGNIAGGARINIYSGLITATTSNAILGAGEVYIETAKIIGSKAHTVMLHQSDTASLSISENPTIENTGNFRAVSAHDLSTQNLIISMRDTGTITSKGGPAIVNYKGTTNIYGGTITGSTYGIYATTGHINYIASVGSVNSVSAIGSNGIAMRVTTGTITLGKDSGFLAKTPTIKGKTYGIQITGTEGTLNFYDCMVYGGTSAISNSGTLNIKSDNGDVSYGVNTSTETTTIGSTDVTCEKKMIVRAIFLNNTTKSYYDNLTDAINTAESGDNILVQTDATDDATSAYTIDKEISLVFNSSYTLNVSQSFDITSSGTLNLTGYGGTINSTAGNAIINAGKFSGTAPYMVVTSTSTCIRNTGTFTVNSMYGGLECESGIVISNSENGIVEIIDCNIIGPTGIYNSSKAETAVTISGGYIYGNSIAGINMSANSGGVVINSGEISGYTLGTYVQGGTLTIGTITGSVTSENSEEVPIIKGKSQGVHIYSGATVKYYSGVIYGGTNAIKNSGKLTPRSGYSVKNSTESTDIYGTTVSCQKAMLGT